MASIDKRGDGYRVRWREGGRSRSRQCPDYATAKRLKRQVEQSRALGQRWEPATAGRLPLLGEVAEAYLTSRAIALADNTLRRYAESLDLFLEFLRARDGRHRWTTQDLSKQLLRDWWGWLRTPETGRHGKQRTESTCRSHLLVVQGRRGLWTWAWEHDEFGPDVPRPRAIELPKKRQHRPVAPTWAEVDAILAALDTGPGAERRRCVARALRLARYTGIRREAVLLLHWSDVDLEAGVLEVRPENTKGGRSGRVLPLHPTLAQDLAGWGRREGYLVGPELGGTSGKAAHLGRTIHRARQRAGVGPNAWLGQPMHAARKCLRTHLVAVGVQPDIIDALLGHVGRGTGGRTYTDRADPRVWARLVEAVGTIPPVGEVDAGVLNLRHPDAGRA